MRGSVVSGSSMKFHKSHSAEAGAVVEHQMPERVEHVIDPAKELLEKPRTTRRGYLESPSGRAATAPTTHALDLTHVHAPSVKLDSPPRSPQSARLEAERAARLLPGGAPPEDPPEVATQSKEDELAFVRDDVGHGSTAVVRAIPRAPFFPQALVPHVDLDPSWRIMSLLVGNHECLRLALLEEGVPAHAIPENAFHFVPCPDGVAITLRVRNDSGRPACFQAVLVGKAAPKATPKALPPGPV